MILTLRQRIVLLFLPVVLLLLGTGIAGVWMLDNLGRRSEDIIRENVVSLKAMFDLEQALGELHRVTRQMVYEAGDTRPRHRQLFQEAASRARQAIEVELNNVTVTGEKEEADALVECVEQMLKQGRQLTEGPEEDRSRRFSIIEANHEQAQVHLQNIWKLNEETIYAADRAARETARRSVVALTLTVVGGLLLTLALGWWLHRTILGPIRSITEAAQAIGGGRLELLVPVFGRDELGQLAQSFNAMTSKLRAYRQSNTERLLRAQQTAQATIDSFADPVVVLDPEGKVELTNPAAQRVLGVCPPETNTPPRVWQPPDPLAPAVTLALCQQRATLTESFEQAISFRLEGQDAQYLPQVRPIRSHEGVTLGAALVLHDVTRFRLLDRLKSDWVATVSHELKTPLTSVRLAVHVLLEELVGPLEPQQVELLIEARENTERLFRLIEHLLALARLEEGHERLDVRPTDGRALLEAAAHDARARAEDRHLNLVVEVAEAVPVLRVDAIRIRRALDNLIDNALRHTPPGGTVTLSLRSNDSGQIQIDVADTGIGIPAEHLPHIFERFYRVPGREPQSGDVQGTGLGLAIVREVVEAHGGQVVCASEPEQGTRFTLTLPPTEDCP
jgi:signal transduction histidine kinase